MLQVFLRSAQQVKTIGASQERGTHFHSAFGITLGEIRSHARGAGKGP